MAALAPLVTLPAIALVFVREPRARHAHYVRSEDLDPLCVCPCTSPLVPLKRGDTLCRCPCHDKTKGTRFAPALCGLVPAYRWSVPKVTNATLCQTCHVHACTLQMHPPPPPPAREVKPMCVAYCPFTTRPARVRCFLDEGHEGLHVGIAKQGKKSGKLSWV